MRKANWTAVLAIVSIVLVMLLFGLGGFWLLFGTTGGMMGGGTSWQGMMSRLCPRCVGGHGLLGSPRTLLFIGLFVLLPLGLFLLLIVGIVWLVHRANRPAP